MSRPMMADFGLPSPERGIGLAAHDFVQGFCARNVVLTRARRVDGAPTVPARWLQRLDAVLESAGIKPEQTMIEGGRWLALARDLDHSAEQVPCARPAPCPPVALRPRTLSVTKIETWLADPYGIYAQHILRLRKLDPLEKAPDMADRGTVLHKALDDFLKACPDRVLPADARERLLAAGRAALDRRSDDPGAWDFWWPRFERMADWTIEQEKKWRQSAAPAQTEAKGQMTLQVPHAPFTLTARADRIDRFDDGTYAVLDYKSGGAYNKKGMQNGRLPQLPLEAVILESGGFESLPPGKVGYIGYWVITGGQEAGKEIAISDNISTVLDSTVNSLSALIQGYDDESKPYHSLPDPDRAPRFNDYEQLARVQEWAALGEADLEDAA
jgi:ATP-dependent helicase/nuclease subunit B